MDTKKASFSSSVRVHLKTIFFLSFWFAIPAVLLAFLVSRPDLGVPAPQIYQEELQEASGAFQVPFKVRLKGVDTKVDGNQMIFVQLAEEADPASPSAQQAKVFTFESAVVRQDENDPEVFSGRLLFDKPLKEAFWTVWVKGPLHLQRQFDGIITEKEFDFAGQPLLPGDIIMPDTGQDNKIDGIDREYLLSLIAKNGAGLTEEEIKSSDLNLDNKINDEDLFLLGDLGGWKEEVLTVQPAIGNTEPCSRPLPPLSVLAQTGPGVGQITLYWTPASNADYYTITYGLASGGYIYGSPNIGNRNQYTVSGLAPGRVYYFVLTAVNNICGSSGYSEEAQSRVGGTLPAVVANETKGGWQASGAGRPGIVPSAQPVPSGEAMIQPFEQASESAWLATVSAVPSPLPTAFIPPKQEPFWRGLSFWSKVGIAAGVIFIVLLIISSFKFKSRKPGLAKSSGGVSPQSSDMASTPVSADKMVARQTVLDEPVKETESIDRQVSASPADTEDESPAVSIEEEKPVSAEPVEKESFTPTTWPPPQPPVQPQQNEEVKTFPNDNFPTTPQSSKGEELKI